MNILNDKNLSKEQREAILCKDQNVLVSAGPGSGKTVVIVNRVFNLIKNEGVSPRNIIVITFTKAAATNMRRRFMALNPSGVSPFFGTFHGLCYKILKSFYGEANIIEGWESYRVVKNFLTTYMEDVSEDRIKDYLNAISIYKCRGIIDEKNKNIDVDIMNNCSKFYESYKKEKGLWDFEDLQILCRDLLKRNAKVLHNYRMIFKHILVDEFQDTDDIQVEILKLLKGDNNIFVVGDEDQCIYSFRGANPTYMVEFNKAFGSGKLLYLSTNYRSTKNIVDISMMTIKNNSMRTEKIIKSNTLENGIIRFKGVQSETNEGDYIGDNILKLKESNSMNFNDFAVLYRTNLESRSIIDSFIKKRIPFTLLDRQYNFFSHFICKDMLAYLKLSIYPLDIESLIRIINKPYRYISKQVLEKLKKDNGLGTVFMRLKDIETLPNFQVKSIEKLERDIDSLNKMSLLSAVDFIISDLLYHDHLKEYAKKYSLSLEDLENVLNEFKESVKGFKNIREFLDHVNAVEEEIQKAQNKKEVEDAVVLSTIHGVKGMEFDTVFMINVVDGLIPYKDNDLEEERRLFYVGLTRAINNVFFVAPTMIRGEKRNKSLFLQECNLSDYMPEREEYKVGTKVNHSFYGEGIVSELKDNNITIKFSDMERKFDFIVVLNNGLIEVLLK